MNIEHHIAQLLYRYQCVTVSGFGAFLTEIQPAQLIEISNSFFPPQKIISFNPNIKNNDGLLANHIAVSTKTSYEFSVKSIEEQVFIWKKSLQHEGFISLKNIGDFTLSADGNLIFTPADQINYLSSSFGLSSFVSPVVKRELIENELEEIAKSGAETAVVDIVNNRNSAKAYLKYAAVFVLGLGITGTIAIEAYRQQIDKQTIIVQKSVQKKVQSKIQEATFFIVNPVASVTLSIKEEKMSYHIMAGAFKNEKNAQIKFLELSSQGYKARRIPQNKYGLFPVLYGSYATYQEAENVKDTIVKKTNPDAWILIESL